MESSVYGVSASTTAANLSELMSVCEGEGRGVAAAHIKASVRSLCSLIMEHRM